MKTCVFGRRALRQGWLLLVLVGLAGCGGGPKLYPVRGKVVYPDGSPMKGGAVMFEPVDNTMNVMSKGMINKENGTFVLGTYKEGDGAMEGRYRVLVRGGQNHPRSAVEDPELIGQIHPRFLSFETSGLEFTVEPKKNEFVLTVEKAPTPRK
jgi:hypothetical protein